MDSEPFSIVFVEAWECALPLPSPIHLGDISYATRDYFVVRVRLQDGTTGTAVGYTRTLPMHDTLGRLYDSMAGRVFCDERGPYMHMRNTFAITWPSVVRCASLIDIAVWDALARRDDVAVYQMLGATKTQVRMLGVCGYYSEVKSMHSIAREAAELLESGYSEVKVLAPRTEAPQLAAFVDAILETVNGRAGLALDFYGAWMTASAALPYLLPLDTKGLTFVEDLVRPGLWRECRALRSTLRTPVAAGEDVTGEEQYGDLIAGQAVAVLRVDVTASGGFSGCVDVARAAHDAGIRVLPHVFPGLHAHLAGTGAVDCVEQIPGAVGTDPLDILIASESRIPDGGDVSLIERGPGHGLTFDWPAVRATAVRTSRWGQA